MAKEVRHVRSYSSMDTRGALGNIVSTIVNHIGVWLLSQLCRRDEHRLFADLRQGVVRVDRLLMLSACLAQLGRFQHLNEVIDTDTFWCKICRPV
jgi:hypothetical protein